MTDRRESAPRTEEIHTLGSYLRVPFEAMLAHNYAAIRELGYEDIRVAHGAVFRNISSSGSRITDLAARAGITKQSMAELVGYLEKRGYLVGSPDPDDRRSRLVKLTEKGQAVFDALVKASHGFEEECRRRLGPRKWERFKSLVQDVADVLDPLRLEASSSVGKRSQ